MLLGRETILRDGQAVGWLASAGFGHHLGVSIGMGYVRHIDGVDKDFILKAQYQLKVADRLFDCSAQLTPPFDPNMESCLLYTSPSPRDRQKSRMPSSA